MEERILYNKSKIVVCKLSSQQEVVWEFDQREGSPIWQLAAARVPSSAYILCTGPLVYF